MLNVQFGGSNSAQVPICELMDGDRVETLYVAPNDAQSMMNILHDIRHMSQSEYDSIIEALSLHV